MGARGRHSGLAYVLTALASAALLLAAVAAFNAVVDPYGMYRWVEAAGFNAHKPAIYHRVRLLKAFEVRRMAPRAIALGSSRSHLALRPSHPGWDAGPVYNLAFDGATTREMYHYLRHAHAGQRLEQVVLGLDSYHPTPWAATVRPDFDPLLLRAPGLGPPHWLAADLRLLTSLDTLQESLRTLRSQWDAPEWYAPDGQRLGEVFFRRPGEMFREQGPRAYFDEINRMEVGFQVVPPPDPDQPPAPPPEETSLDYVRKIVDFCRREGIDLRLFITPAHVYQMEIAAEMGSWGTIEQGRRALVELLDEEARRHTGAEPFPLYDFGGYNAVTTEALPPRGSQREMRYYWDSSHFKEGVGDRVLDRVLARPDGPAPADGFGLRLTPGNIDQALAQLRAARDAYRAAHRRELAALRAMVAEVRRRHLGPADPVALAE